MHIAFHALARQLLLLSLLYSAACTQMYVVVCPTHMSAHCSLKNYNNWVKSVLIDLYLCEHASVLDICCGKGGDLAKFNQSKPPLFYVGADHAHLSICDFIERYTQAISPSSCTRLRSAYHVGRALSNKCHSGMRAATQRSLLTSFC